jgi:phosphomethylpyrimidine synthase
MEEHLTQQGFARKGIVTDCMKHVAQDEQVPVEVLLERLRKGTVVIPANKRRKNLKPVGIGEGLKIKVNVNLGRSQTSSCLSEEMEKVKIAMQLGADTIMDLSTGPGLKEIRSAILSFCHLPLGTVPVYEACDEAKDPKDITLDEFFDVVRRQAEEGVDFMTIHAGLIRSHIPYIKQRLTGVVSRGGAVMLRWMQWHDRENPYYEYFDDVLDICKEYDVTISLGDGLRPGSLYDASDEAQMRELQTLGELVQRAWDKGVQVMVEGPGHIPLHEIAWNVKKQKETCKGAPFYVLGPLVTDIAAGYDHISGAIGAAFAAWMGADFLCYVTPKEHLGLPNIEDVRNGLVAFKIAAHAADIARGIKGARDRDDEMSKARFDFDWERQFSLSLDPERARAYHDETLPEPKFKESQFCSMCGPRYCPMKLAKEILK